MGALGVLEGRRDEIGEGGEDGGEDGEDGVVRALEALGVLKEILGMTVQLFLAYKTCWRGDLLSETDHMWPKIDMGPGPELRDVIVPACRRKPRRQSLKRIETSETELRTESIGARYILCVSASARLFWIFHCIFV